MNPSRLGIFTLGNVSAFITSFSPMILLSAARINTYDDGYGNTTGTIGRDRINLHTDPSGVTTGTVGQRRLNCYSNRFSTTCY